MKRKRHHQSDRCGQASTHLNNQLLDGLESTIPFTLISTLSDYLSTIFP